MINLFPELILMLIGDYCSDVKLNGFTSSVPLPQASSHDSILCCEIGDFDFDGRNEVALGTFGKVSTSIYVFFSI